MCMQLLSRTYAQAVAGVTSLMHYDQATSNFTLKYHTTAACDSLVTEVSHITCTEYILNVSANLLEFCVMFQQGLLEQGAAL